MSSEEDELHPHATLADSSAVRFTHLRRENLKGENYSRRSGCGHPCWIFAYLVINVSEPSLLIVEPSGAGGPGIYKKIVSE